ncbi:alanine--tRNA ligase [Dioscorea cayenensis subsp. rotundata]|uniref:Alanine--tRNA ligase n=1 Tax=Dioscorea cayennensis subsp. rotundata TaxID=55577 RepID=A0AB40BHQ9_DIOCR|nr:alanine--tRNA ligase [Dioscorea cayenensis subsp. rotundata]
MEQSPTKLSYFDDMRALTSSATILSISQEDSGRRAVILDSTIFYPQGGGQPSDTGFISNSTSDFKFIVQDVRLKDGVVWHYGILECLEDACESKFEGQEVSLHVDAERRDFNSRLHSAGHLLDVCMRKVGSSHLEPGKGYHFPDGPFVEYKGVIPKDQIQIKQKELEAEANALISSGGKVLVSILPYDEAAKWCGGDLPSYIAEGSTPRIVKLGDNLGGPCGGTHVTDIADIGSLKVSQIRTKKGFTKVFYNINP